MTLIQTVETEGLALIIAESEANQATVTSWFGSGEAAVQTLFTNLIKQIPSIKGALGLVANPIEAAVEAAIESYVSNLISKYGPAQLFTLYIGFLQKLQSDVSPSAAPAVASAAPAPTPVAPVAAVKAAPPTSGIIGAP